LPNILDTGKKSGPFMGRSCIKSRLGSH